MILALLVDRDPVMRHVAEAVTALDQGIVATHVLGLDGLARTLSAVLPDVVVTDLSLTASGPADALESVRALWPGPLLALSGDTSRAADSACVVHAARRLVKPLTPLAIAEAIRAHAGVRP